jgi:hypothetical protein
MTTQSHLTHLSEFGIVQCNFCGASQEDSITDDVSHYENCCVPLGKDAIKKEQAIINHICTDAAIEN